MTQGVMTLEDVLLVPGALRTVFQPIVRRLGGECVVHALECLTRGPAGTPYADACRLFTEARDRGLEVEVDRACVTTALETVQRFGIADPLFVNVHPATLVRDPEFPTMLATTAARCDVALGRVTVEVTEHDRGADWDTLVNAVRTLNRRGVSVALDDYGAGSNDHHALQTWRPRWVKLDGHLFRGARLWTTAWQIVDAVVAAATRAGVGVIAEGLDRASDIRVAAELGIELVQGYTICRPLEAKDAVFAHGCLGRAAVA